MNKIKIFRQIIDGKTNKKALEECEVTKIKINKLDFYYFKDEKYKSNWILDPKTGLAVNYAFSDETKKSAVLNVEENIEKYLEFINSEFYDKKVKEYESSCRLYSRQIKQ